MSKLKLLGIAVAGLIVMNLGLLGFLFFAKPPKPEAAQQQDAPRDRPFGPPLREPKQVIIERLHFDQEQVAQYETLVQQHRSTINETDRQIRETKNSLYATLNSGNSVTADSLQNILTQLHRKIEDTHYNHFAAIKKLCRPDQLAYFNELTKELAGFFAPGKNGPPPPPRPGE